MSGQVELYSQTNGAPRKEKQQNNKFIFVFLFLGELHSHHSLPLTRLNASEEGMVAISTEYCRDGDSFRRLFTSRQRKESGRDIDWPRILDQSNLFPLFPDETHSIRQ